MDWVLFWKIVLYGVSCLSGFLFWGGVKLIQDDEFDADGSDLLVILILFGVALACIAGAVALK